MSWRDLQGGVLGELESWSDGNKLVLYICEYLVYPEEIVFVHEWCAIVVWGNIFCVREVGKGCPGIRKDREGLWGIGINGWSRELVRDRQGGFLP